LSLFQQQILRPNIFVKEELKNRNRASPRIRRQFTNTVPNPLAVPVPAPVVTLSQLPAIFSLKIADHSFTYRSPRLGINSPIYFVSLASPVSIHLLIHSSAHLRHHHHSQHPSLLHSFTPGSVPTFSTNPSYLNRLLAPLGLPSRIMGQ